MRGCFRFQSLNSVHLLQSASDLGRMTLSASLIDNQVSGGVIEGSHAEPALVASAARQYLDTVWVTSKASLVAAAAVLNNMIGYMA